MNHRIVETFNQKVLKLFNEIGVLDFTKKKPENLKIITVKYII